MVTVHAKAASCAAAIRGASAAQIYGTLSIPLLPFYLVATGKRGFRVRRLRRLLAEFFLDVVSLRRRVLPEPRRLLFEAPSSARDAVHLPRRRPGVVRRHRPLRVHERLDQRAQDHLLTEHAVQSSTIYTPYKHETACVCRLPVLASRRLPVQARIYVVRGFCSHIAVLLASSRASSVLAHICKKYTETTLSLH